MNNVLFLTSTVTPSVIPFAGSAEERKKEYIKAIKFYLEQTTYKILIVDNSGYDFNKEINNERLEALSYVDSTPNNKGKGYGETLLMIYGFAHSTFLRNAQHVIKITGRHIIYNINSLLRFSKNPYAVYIDCTLDFTFARSYFFVAPKKFYEEYLFPHKEQMDDSAGIYLEHVLGGCLSRWISDGNKCHEFLQPIHIIGRPGTSSIAYQAPGIKRKLMIIIKYVLFEINMQMAKKW